MDDDVSTQAAYWVAKMDSELPSPDLFKKFLQWKDSDPLHASAFGELSAIWAAAEKPKMHGIIAEEQLQYPATDRTTDQSPIAQYLPFSLKISLAASLVIGLCLVVMSGLQINQGAQLQSLQLVTQIGEQKTKKLNDGSELTLNTNSKVNVQYSKNERSIYLTSGEAHFEVAHNSQRPFKVYTPHGNVRAVGTAFTISLANDNLAITVTEGRIAITSSQPSARNKNQPLALVDAGHKVNVSDDHPQIKRIDTVELEKRTAWQKGLLIFDGDSLKSVIEEISRYTDTTIVVTDESINSVKIGGQFRTNEIQGLLESLHNGFGISAHYIDENRVLLFRANPHESKDQKT